MIEIIPMDAPLGAEIRGLDIGRPLDDRQIATIDAAWREHLVLLLRGQNISDAQLIDFSQYFGELDPPGPNPYGEPFHKEFPLINVISNIVVEGRPVGNLGAGEAIWHADMTYIDRPPKAAILYALEIPEGAGNTYFADMFAAYEALPDRLKQTIEGRLAIHDASHNSAGMRRKGYAEITDVRQVPGARHPLVRRDPDSGRKALFLGRRRNSYIVGMEVAESEALLDELWAHAGDRRFAMCHRWRVGDVLMWQNLSVLHRRDAFPTDSRRRLHRTQLKGEQRIA
jgi:taurine dioxygenase